jgi:hypothetical protein
MPLDDRAHDEEPEPQTALLRILTARTAELLEQRRVTRIGGTGSFVVDPKLDTAAVQGTSIEANDAVRRTELARIREQIDDHLDEALMVAANRGQ